VRGGGKKKQTVKTKPGGGRSVKDFGNWYEETERGRLKSGAYRFNWGVYYIGTAMKGDDLFCEEVSEGKGIKKRNCATPHIAEYK